jgi:FMN phosphatase YigB (HAD superfamily)
MLSGILGRFGYEADEVAMVGDRIYTDIEMAHNAGAFGVLVLSGETTLEMCQIAEASGTDTLFLTPHLMYWESASELYDRRERKTQYLEEVLEKHPCIDVMHIVLLRQHGDQLVTQHERDDHPCDRQDHRIRQVLDHAEHATVPPLWCLSQLMGDLPGLLVHIGEHGGEIGVDHVLEQVPHPFFDCFE